MLFVTMIKSLPGTFEESLRAMRRLKIPENIQIREFSGLFGDIDAIISKESAPPIEVASGPATTPIDFSSVSPFGARTAKKKSKWWVVILIVGILAVAGVAVLFFLLFVSG